MSSVRPSITDTPPSPSLKRLLALAGAPQQQLERWRACDEAIEPLETTLDTSPLLAEGCIQVLTEDIGYGKRFQDQVDRHAVGLAAPAPLSAEVMGQRAVPRPPTSAGVRAVPPPPSRQTLSPDQLNALLQTPDAPQPAKTVGKKLPRPVHNAPPVHPPRRVDDGQTRATPDATPTLRAAYHTPVGGKHPSALTPAVTQLLAQYQDSFRDEPGHPADSAAREPSRSGSIPSPQAGRITGPAREEEAAVPAGWNTTSRLDTASPSAPELPQPVAHPRQGLDTHLEKTLARVQQRQKVAHHPGTPASGAPNLLPTAPDRVPEGGEAPEAPRGLRGLAARLKAQNTEPVPTGIGMARTTPGADLEPAARPSPSFPAMESHPSSAPAPVSPRQTDAELSARLSRILRREAQRHGIDLGDSQP